MVIVKATSVDHPHKLAFVADGLFPFLVEDTHTVDIHPPDETVEETSCERVAKMSLPHDHEDPNTTSFLDDGSRILDLLTRHRSHTVTLNASTFETGGGGYGPQICQFRRFWNIAPQRKTFSCTGSWKILENLGTRFMLHYWWSKTIVSWVQV